MKIPRQHELFGFKTGGIDTRGAVGYAREMGGRREGGLQRPGGKEEVGGDGDQPH